MSGSDLIPFGKYKGQPIEVLQSDPQYVDWLMQQDWVRQRFPSVMNVIINNFGEPEETPEHNRLQALFLDETIRQRLGFEVLLKLCDREKNLFRDLAVEGYYTTLSESAIGVGTPIFEASAIDCYFEFFIPTKRYFKASIAIELKPIVGDDYPAILRAMLATRIDQRTRRILVYDSFSSQAVSEEQFRQFFEFSTVFVFQIKEITEFQKELSKESFVLNLFKNAKTEETKRIAGKLLRESTNTDGSQADQIN
jgi:hypothetical protein